MGLYQLHYENITHAQIISIRNKSGGALVSYLKCKTALLELDDKKNSTEHSSKLASKIESLVDNVPLTVIHLNTGTLAQLTH